MAVTRWTSSLLDELAGRADPAVDDLVRRYQEIEQPGEHPRELIAQLVRHGAASRHASFIQRYHLDPVELPTWADRELLERGRQFFQRWSLQLSSSLFYASLPHAYAVEHGAKVLVATGQLAEGADGGGADLTRRIAETGHFLYEVFPTDGSIELEPFGEGYVAARNVRLFHAAVRFWLLDPEQGWDPADGVPINQEDLIGTMLSFTVAAFEAFHHMNLPYKEAEARAYLHAWNVVGSLLGIEPDVLPIDFDDAFDLAHLIAARHQRPSEEGRQLTAALLEDGQGALPPVVDRIPATLLHHLAGKEVATLHDVGAPPRWMQRGAHAMSWLNPILLRYQQGVSVNAWVGRKILRGYIHHRRGERPPWKFVDQAGRGAGTAVGEAVKNARAFAVARAKFPRRS